MKILAAAALLACLAAAADRPPRFLTERHAYLRGELAVIEAESDAALSFDTGGWLAARAQPSGGRARYTIDTGLLRAGEYDVRAATPGGAVAVFPIAIAAARNPQRFPLWNWHGALSPDLRWWTARGFNGFRLPSTSVPPGPPRDAPNLVARVYDEGTRLGVDIGPLLTPLSAARWEKEESSRILLPGGVRGARAYPLEPDVLEYARRTAAAYAERYAAYPSFRHALLSTEVQIPFAVNEVAVERARREAGIDLKAVLRPEWIPGGSAAKPGSEAFRFDLSRLPPALQPAGGLIADDHPVYRFLKWWWERGHGTPAMNAEMAKAIKSVRPDVLTWHDPYRLAPVRGSHAGLDAIGTWTYGHPDIKRLVYPTVLQAAARPERQQVFQNITMWIYGRFVVPLGQSTANLQMDAPGKDPFFTQGPDYIREAMWLTASQRPDGLSFYYAGALPPDRPGLDPWIFSPDGFDAIGEVSRALIEPYGPLILASRRPAARVAVLMSAAAVWFQGAPLHPGYPNEQILPFCGLLMMNHTPFDVLLDDDVVEGRLAGYDALVIGRGDTLTRGVHRRIAEFARSGKRVIADATLRAEIPGAIQTGFDFSFESAVDGKRLAAGTAITGIEHRDRMEAYAAKLKPLLAGLARPAESDRPRALLNSLETGGLRYLFVVNDDRVYGPRFGEWKLMREAGVRQVAKVRVAAPASAALYDALARKPVVFQARDGKLEFETALPAARGKLIAVLPEPVGGVDAVVPPVCPRGGAAEVRVRILGKSGRPLPGAAPLRIDLIDPLGRTAEWSRYAATTAGAGGEYGYVLPFRVALNDPAGEWTVRTTELLGGASSQKTFRVE